MNNNEAPTLEKLLDKVQDYGMDSIELIKLKAVRKVTDVLSSLISKVVVVCSVALSIFILNIGVALWVGALLGKAYYGFFVVAGVYALLSILFSVYRHKVIKHPISNALITKILK